MERRKIGYAEAMSLYLEQKGGEDSHLIAVASVEGNIEPEMMIEAIESLYMRHPILRSVLIKEGKDYFIETGADFANVTVEFLSKKITKEEMIEREMKKGLDPTKALWRVTLSLDSKKKNPIHIIALSCHMTTCDAISSLCFMRELIKAYEKLQRGIKIEHTSLPFLDGVEEFLPTHPILDLYFTHLKKLGEGLLEKGKIEKEGARQSFKVILADLKKEEVEAIQKTAKAHKITTHALLVACYVFSVHQLLKKQKNMAIYTPLDMRGRSIPAIDQSHFGMYAAYVLTLFDGDLDKRDFFDFARFYKEELEKEIPLQAFPPLVENITTEELLNRFNQSPSISMSDALYLNNLGKLPFSKEVHGEHRITSLYFAQSKTVGDFPVMYHIATLEEGMHFCMVYNPTIISQMEAEKLMASFIQRLEKECDFLNKASLEVRKAS